jgi:hypothetical protein
MVFGTCFFKFLDIFLTQINQKKQHFKVAKFYSYTFSADSTGVDAFPCRGRARGLTALPLSLECWELLERLRWPRWPEFCWSHSGAGHVSGCMRSPMGGTLEVFLGPSSSSRPRRGHGGITPKDAFAGKWVVFLAFEIDSCGGGGSLESLMSHSRCFGRLFGYDCVC